MRNMIRSLYATHFSGYKVTTPNVVELAWLDLNVLQIEMLASVGEFDLAYDIYDIGRYSRNSRTEYNSLVKLATSTNLQNAQVLFGLQKSISTVLIIKS